MTAFVEMATLCISIFDLFSQKGTNQAIKLDKEWSMAPWGEKSKIEWGTNEQTFDDWLQVKWNEERRKEKKNNKRFDRKFDSFA